MNDVEIDFLYFKLIFSVTKMSSKSDTTKTYISLTSYALQPFFLV